MRRGLGCCAWDEVEPTSWDFLVSLSNLMKCEGSQIPVPQEHTEIQREPQSGSEPKSYLGGVPAPWPDTEAVSVVLQFSDFWPRTEEGPGEKGWEENLPACTRGSVEMRGWCLSADGGRSVLAPRAPVSSCLSEWLEALFSSTGECLQVDYGKWNRKRSTFRASPTMPCAKS